MFDPLALSRIEDRLERLESLVSKVVKEKWFDLERASIYTGLSTRTLRRAINKGTLTHSKTTGKILFRREWLDRFLIYGRTRLKPGEKKKIKELL